MPYMMLLLLTSLFWGGNFVVGKSLVGHASPMTLTTIRWMIAAICLIPLVWWKEKKFLPPREAILPLFLMGLTGAFLFNILQFLALEHTTAINVGLISTLNVFSIAFFSVLFLKEKISGSQIFSMFISLIGVCLVLSKGHLTLLLSLHFNIGDFWMLTAVCVWGIYSVCSKWAMNHTSAIMSTLYSAIFGLIILLPLNISDFTITNINPTFIASILYTGVISTVVCMVLWNLGVQKLGTTTAGIFLNFNPIFTSLLAFVFLHEQMNWIQVVGSGIVIIGSYLFSHFKTKGTLTHKVFQHSLQH